MKILILTAQDSWPSSYSLSNVTQDQTRGFHDRGDEVRVMGAPGCLNHPSGNHLFDNLVKYEWPSVSSASKPSLEDEELLASFLHSVVAEFQPDIIITHDLIFQTGFVAYARVIHGVSNSISGQWVHYIHSITTGKPPPSAHWSIKKIPDGHLVVALSPGCVGNLSHYYGVPSSRIITVANPVDPGRLFGWTDRVRVLHDLGFGHCVISAVLPVCATRLASKNVSDVVRVFDRFEEMGVSSKLVIATSGANGDREFEALRKLGRPNVLLTASLFPQTRQYGLNHHELSSLYQMSSVFFNLSQGEACSMTLAEASICGLPVVINENQDQLLVRQPAACLKTRYNTFSKTVHRECADDSDPETEYSQWVAEQTVKLVDQTKSFGKSKSMQAYSPVSHAQSIIDQVNTRVPSCPNN